MGNLLAYCYKSDTVLQKEEEPKPVFSWDKREEIDPADYCFENLDGKKRGKFPGQICGQQFGIDNCKNCILFVLDNVASLTIDDCENCVIFIGPSKGSVFIRDCTDIKLAVSCQQFRTRDCKRIETYLHCSTQPIIESSVGMKFGCLQINYPGLSDQVISAGLSLYNNEWSSIYDFTPVEHASNFTLMTGTAVFDRYLTPEHISEAGAGKKVEFTSSNSLFPLTVGNSDNHSTSDSALLSVFLGTKGGYSEVDAMLKMLEKCECRLRRSKETHMNTDTVIRIYGEAVNTNTLSKLAKDGPVIGFEVEGDINQLRATLPSYNDILIYMSNGENSSKDISNFFNYVDMTMST